jgi:AraC-like DNA-binding protein
VITRGEGTYQDANGFSGGVRAGDAIFVHPALPHSYGPAPGTTWDEFFLVFGGPAFDAWHAMGLLDPKRPLYSLAPTGDWLPRFRALADVPGLPAPPAKAQQVCRLLTLLTEVVLSRPAPPTAPAPNPWLAQACSLLGGSLDSGLPLPDLVRPLGMPYETFRRRFTREMGVPPARFRAERTVEAACHLLQYTGLSGAKIAERLAFSDEYHFSRRFKQVRGETPAAFRRRLLR